MPNSHCPEKLILEQLMLGLIPEGQAATLEEHVTLCSRCADTVGKLSLVDPLVEAVRGIRGSDVCGNLDEAQAIIPWLKRMRPRETPPTLAPAGDDATLPPTSPRAEEAPSHTGDDVTLPPQAGPNDTVDIPPPCLNESPAAEPTRFSFLAPPQEPDEIGRLGPYRVLKQLGAGGMGIVFLAEDPLLKRQIALKVIKPELVEHADVRDRFIQEAQAVAKVEHDNIVAIFQVSEDRGVPYLAMPLLRGQSLDEYLKSKPGPLPLPEILLLGREIAAGLAAAHDKGLVHRDIKPGNIWLEVRAEHDKVTGWQGDKVTAERQHGRAGKSGDVHPVAPSPCHPVTLSPAHLVTPRVKILDFGLAQAAHDLNMNDGKVVGTPAFMAPEQVQGDALDGRADLFSLGCVVYRMATGEPPFKGIDTISTLINVATIDPRPPRDVNPDVPPALADLIVNLLAKSPAGRPASAHEVVTEIEAMEEALRPKPSRLRWWLLTAAAVLAGIGITLWMLPPAPPVEPVLPGEVTFAYDEPDGRVLLQNGDEPPKEIDLKEIQLVSLMPGDYRIYPAAALKNREMVPDRIVVEPGKTTRVDLSLVGEVMEDHWHSQTVWGVALSPRKGDLLAVSVSGDRSIRLWNALKSKESREIGGHDSEVRSVAISRDGRFALTGSGGKGKRADQSIRLWDLGTGQLPESPREPVARFLGHQSWVTALAFAPNGKTFLSGGADGLAFIWDIKRELTIFTLAHHDGLGIASVAFSPDGKRALTGGGDKLVCLWDTANGKLLKELTGHTAEVRCVAFAPNGLEAASASWDGTIRIWDLAAGKARTIHADKDGVNCLAYSPDSKRLISGGRDELVRLWDVATGDEIYRFKGHHKAVQSVAFAPDGRRAVSGGVDQTVRLWELPK